MIANARVSSMMMSMTKTVRVIMKEKKGKYSASGLKESSQAVALFPNKLRAINLSQNGNFKRVK